MIKIGKYTITQEDRMNFGLYETRPSTKKDGSESTTEYLHGYYGYINMALSKILNQEILYASEGSEESLTANGMYVLIMDTLKEIDSNYKVWAKEVYRD